MKIIENLCIIDDDRICQFIIKTYAKAKALAKHTHIFADASSALEYLKSMSDNTPQLPDLIMLDINMPIMDGWSFLDEYQKLSPWINKKIPIFLITSSIQEEDKMKAKQYNDVAGFYIKPINEELIMNIFHQLPN
ncbi:response regulator [Solitalea sp. MAHUQ-68]|uniref:Response regulator n=1 Tax=Solitalea agri TaxID=2953739 RepID=A0A9X2FD03_9SPHI|nr:response regulator [Solitalea agri]MCO4294598.1 response regulator [Solitalea agri]